MDLNSKRDDKVRNIGTKVYTGQRCPESGIWKVIGHLTTTAPIAKGNVMPPYAGNGVWWKLIVLA